MSLGPPRVGVREKLATTGGGTGPYIAANGGAAISAPGGTLFGGSSGPPPGGGGGTNCGAILGATFIFLVLSFSVLKTLYS